MRRQLNRRLRREHRTMPLSAAVLFDRPMLLLVMVNSPSRSQHVGFVYFRLMVDRSAGPSLRRLRWRRLNAVDALMTILEGAVRSLPQSLRGGAVTVADAELADWETITAGVVALADQGARPRDASASAEFRAAR